MSDNGSIVGAVAEGLKGLATDAVKQVTSAPGDAAKTAVSQTIGITKTPEEEARKKAEEAFRLQRAKEIEAEMKQIALERDERTGPEIPNDTTSASDAGQNFTPSTAQTADAAVNPASIKTETDRRRE